MGTSARAAGGEAPWVSLWRFAVHIMVASGIFLLVATPAVLLDFLVQWLTSLHVSAVVIVGLQLAEYTLFGVDVFLLIAYAIRTGWRTMKAL